MRLKDVVARVEGAAVIRDAEITGIVCDSRRVEPGFLFVAIKGVEQDGRRFIPDALSRGAAAVMTESNGESTAAWAEKGCCVVPDARIGLSSASNLFYGEPGKSLLVVGVTGTKGKSTTCHMVKSVLEACGEKVGLTGTVHSIVANKERPSERTTSEAPLLHGLLRDMVSAGLTAATVEVSSHALALERVRDVAFDVGVLTNIGRDHLDFHQTIEDYVASKKRLFELTASSGAKKKGGPLWVMNADDPHLGGLRPPKGTNLVTYGCEAGATVRATDVILDRHGATFTLGFADRSGKAHIFLPGLFNVYNALAAAAVAFGLGMGFSDIVAGLSQVKKVRGRVEAVQGPGDYSVWVDYAHTPESLEDILDLARQMTDSAVIVVFGCGGRRDKGKRPLMGKVAADLADTVVITNDNPRTEDPKEILRQIQEGTKQSVSDAQVLMIEDRAKAIHKAIDLADPGDIVILAGKGHETYQEFGDRTVHFDDAEVALEAMRSRFARERGLSE